MGTRKVDSHSSINSRHSREYGDPRVICQHIKAISRGYSEDVALNSEQIENIDHSSVLCLLQFCLWNWTVVVRWNSESGHYAEGVTTLSPGL